MTDTTDDVTTFDVTAPETPPDPQANGHAKWLYSKPILADLSGANGFNPTEHAVERMGERRISPEEVASTLIKPDITQTDWSEQYNCRVWAFKRGDIEVIANMESGDILTVIDRNGDERTEPRQPNTTVEGRPEVKKPSGKLTSAAKSTARKATANAYLSKMDAAATREEFDYVFGTHDAEDIRYIDITPKLAAAMLERNTRNRPKRDRDVDDWSGEQQAGRWLTTHQGVAFDRNGVLVDGQHRLEAIVDSGETVRMPVAVGLDPAVFDVIDTGRKRTTQDSLALLGETRTTVYASVIRLAYRYDNNMFEPNTRYRVQTKAQLDYLKGREELFRAASEYGGKLRASGRILASSGGVAYVLLKRELPRRCQVLADEFLDGINDGFGLTRGDPRWALRRVCANDQRRDPVVHLGLILKAWMHYAKGNHVQVVTWRMNEGVPKPYIPAPDLQRKLFSEAQEED